MIAENKQILKVLGEEIRQKRIENRMTQKQLGEKMGVLAATVSAWELGKIQPGFLTTVKLARVLKIKIKRVFEEAKL